MLGREGADFSFSGLKTAVRQVVREGDYQPGDEADLAAAFQAAVIASLADRTKAAMAMFRADFPDASDAGAGRGRRAWPPTARSAARWARSARRRVST